ncbi:MAG: sugar metabolism cluster protein [Planctomycetes bacterium]|nr:sugar metabolism cluster protein [Planctomycetota bacterium]
MTKSKTSVHEAPERRVVILGAGRGVTGNLPPAMVPVGPEHRVLDWLLSSFAPLPDCQIFFIGGYKAQVVESQYPDIRFFFNPDWGETGPVGSLAVVPLAARGATYVCYSDVVFRADLVRRMDAAEADIVLAVDTRWQVRYDARSRADLDAAEKVRVTAGRVEAVGKRVTTSEATGEFAGLVKLSGAAAQRLEGMIDDGALGDRAGVPDAVNMLIDAGLDTAVVDVEGDWAELNAPQDLARFVLGTKAESLARLRPLVRSGTIGESVSFTLARWREGRAERIGEIQETFGDTNLIVRSSALSEDNWLNSSAGAYTSLLDIPSGDGARLEAAVDEVFRSYGAEYDDDQVLIQEMLRDVVMSGVVMTRTPTLGAAYYVINFDDSTARTDTVTAGDSDALRTVFLHRGATLRDDVPPALGDLVEIVDEVERLVGHDSLDIEFAFTGRGDERRGHILQVRPIAVAHRDQPVDDDRISEGIDDAVRYFRQLRSATPFLLGSTTQFSVMTDWNPAEMIGTKPSRLAFSLYRHLITDEAWARQRAEYGYRDVRPSNLIVDFLGHPYVDVRVDFNSFLPASLPDELARRLADHYLDHLARHPELHDKVEFDVLYTCAAFDFDEQAGRLRSAGFSETDIAGLREALNDVTRRGIARCPGDVADLDVYARRFDEVSVVETAPLQRAFLLLEDVRRIGVPLFSHLARHAFVAVALLRSLRDAGRITERDVERFLASVRTVPSAMKDDARAVADGRMEWEAFCATYGHLRPGSYDITSPCYAAVPEEFLRPMIDAAAREPAAPADGEPWDDDTRRAVAEALGELDLGVDLDGFDRFLRQAIEGREFGKFTFMRSVNGALEALAEFGVAHGLTREELAQVRYQEFMSLRAANTERVAEALQRLSRRGREASYVTQAACLPAQLFREEDFVCFELLKAEPNFVTRQMVRAETAALSGRVSPDMDVTGRIVLIPNADPGFDWLFSREIAGLITMYGGVNSHMAIRAAEFQLPAAIGVGELLYEEISQAQMLELDCGSRQIRVVH